MTHKYVNLKVGVGECSSNTAKDKAAMYVVENLRKLKTKDQQFQWLRRFAEEVVDIGNFK